MESLVVKANVNAIIADASKLLYIESYVNVYEAPLTGGTGSLIAKATGLGVPMDFAGQDAARAYAVTAHTHGGGFNLDQKSLAFAK